MSKVTYRTILVIGDNHKEIAHKYSADKKVSPYVIVKFDDAEKKKQKQLKLIETILTNKQLSLSSKEYDKYKDMYLDLSKTDSFDYFRTITEGCFYDEITGDALSTYNPKAFYKYERCQQHRLEVTGEEGTFSDPFPLKDGGRSYSAHFSDIDWKLLHKNEDKIKLYDKVWELVVNNVTPVTEQEENIKERMCNRLDYFDNFSTKEHYIQYSTSFWHWGIATEKKYEEVNYKISDIEWCCNFYDKYIKGLEKTNPLITIYETHSLD